MVCVHCTASWSEEFYANRHPPSKPVKPPQITSYQARIIEKLRKGFSIIDNPRMNHHEPPYLIVKGDRKLAISVITLKALVRHGVIDEEFNLLDFLE